MLIKPPEPKGKLDTVTVNGPEDVPDWDAIDWRTHEGNVRRLRRRIFKATREQDWAQVRSLQKMMLRSWSNTLISVRQVTQRNAGRRTAGVDGQVQLTAAQLSFEDILVGDKGVPPSGLHLTDVRVTTRAAHECDWVDWAPDGDACSASIPAVFYLDWSMVATDGAVVPLGTQELAPMDVWVDVAGDERGIAADLRVLEPDTLWSWAGVVEFRHLVIEVGGHEIMPL